MIYKYPNFPLKRAIRGSETHRQFPGSEQIDPEVRSAVALIFRSPELRRLERAINGRHKAGVASALGCCLFSCFLLDLLAGPRKKAGVLFEDLIVFLGLFLPPER